MKNNQPMYRQIADIIKNKITEGIYENNSIIPGEKQLMDEFDVSRVTIRKALEMLKEKGFVQSRPGFGTYVSYVDTSHYKFTSLKSFTSEMKEIGKNTNTIYSILKKTKATKDLAKLFRCQMGDLLYYLERVRGDNLEPIVVSETYLKLDIVLPDTQKFLYGSLYQYLMKNGIMFASMKEELYARLPKKSIAKTLKITEEKPVLVRERYAYTKDNALVEYTTNYYNSEHYKYTINMSSVNY